VKLYHRIFKAKEILRYLVEAAIERGVMRVRLIEPFELSDQHEATRSGKPVLVNNTDGKAYGLDESIPALFGHTWNPRQLVQFCMRRKGPKEFSKEERKFAEKLLKQ
jgi:uncharacterized protein YbaR (Trm112 family)